MFSNVLGAQRSCMVFGWGPVSSSNWQRSSWYSIRQARTSSSCNYNLKTCFSICMQKFRHIIRCTYPSIVPVKNFFYFYKESMPKKIVTVICPALVFVKVKYLFKKRISVMHIFLWFVSRFGVIKSRTYASI